MKKFKKIKNICYVLNSFPNLSETFISDEAFSMYGCGVTPHILSLKEGNTVTVHPAAEKLLNSGNVTLVTHVPRATALKAVLRLFMMQPFHTAICFIKSLGSTDRWLYFQTAPYALSLLRNKIDFIHAHFADFNFCWAASLSRWTGIPFGVTTHRHDLRHDPITISRVTKLFLEANLIVTISDNNRNIMVEKYIIPFDKINIVHCGVDLTRFIFSDNIRKFEKRKLRLINVGRLVSEKGQEILIQALSEVKNRGIDFNLTIIGEGPLLNELAHLSAMLNLNNYIHFAGAQTQSRVISMLEESDVFVLSSRDEGLPVACMETMAVGTLLIATRINGIPELVQDKVNGLLFEPDDVIGLADSICWVIENHRSLQNIVTSARQKIEVDFDRIKCTKLLLEYMTLSC